MTRRAQINQSVQPNKHMLKLHHACNKRTQKGVLVVIVRYNDRHLESQTDVSVFCRRYGVCCCTRHRNEKPLA